MTACLILLLQHTSLSYVLESVVIPNRFLLAYKWVKLSVIVYNVLETAGRSSLEIKNLLLF